MACFAVAPVADMYKKLRITEIFHSLQGEANTSGCPTTFIRLTGCPLRCQYCDTSYAFSGGQLMTVEQILQQVAGFRPRYVCVTGGEPLAQPECLVLLTQLCDKGYQVSLETSGALDVSAVDSRVSRVVDLKTPDSGEASRNLYSNLSYLNLQDQIKFVLCSRADYDWAVACVQQYGLDRQVDAVWFSAAMGQLEPKQLADWIVADNLPVRLQIQLHKVLWNDAQGR